MCHAETDRSALCLVVEVFTTLSLLLGIYRHRRAAHGFKNLYDALGRGMVYLVEAM